jgi:hypothetical protein
MFELNKWETDSDQITYDKDMIEFIGSKLLLLFRYIKDVYKDAEVYDGKFRFGRSQLNTELFNIFDLLELDKDKNLKKQGSVRSDWLDEFIKTKKSEEK